MWVHLEGMGVIGSILAWAFLGRGIDFTWEDLGTEICAWKASGGAIFSGSSLDDNCLDTWRQWRGVEPFGLFLTEAPTWYSTKKPPHGARYSPAHALDGDGGVVLSRAPDSHTSLYLNVPEFVRYTQNHFRALRTDGPIDGATRIIAHGYGTRLRMYLWGWTSVVRLEIEPELLEASLPFRPGFYLRKGRFVMLYAAPMGDGENYLIGSSMIAQMRNPHPLDVQSKVDKWVENARELSGGLFSVKSVLTHRQGWRPMGGVEDSIQVVTGPDGTVHCPSMGHSGVRHAPALVANVLTALG